MKAEVASALVVAACFAIVAARAAAAPAFVPKRRATPQEMKTLAADVRANEPIWRAKSTESFPRDLWSQRDDFHGHERSRIQDLTTVRKVPIEDVLRAIDDDIHDGYAHDPLGETRSARAIPCKPRPYYD